MTLTEFLRPKLNFFVIITVLITFISLDNLVIPKIIAGHIQPSSAYRTPTHFNFGELKAFIDLINQDSSPKLILTGDSIIQGGGVEQGEDTISNQLQQALHRNSSPYHVYNLGLSGAAPADSFFIVKSLRLTSKDIVVYDLNISHYISEKLVFPSITGALSAKEFHGHSLYELLGMKSTDKLEDRLQLFVTDHWKLYAYRDLILDQYETNYFGKQKTSDSINYKPWYQLDWSSLTQGTAKRGSNDFRDTDSALLFTRYLIQAVRDHGARILIFNIPLNQEMMAKYDMIDRPLYNKGISRLRAAVEAEGAKFADYQTLIPGPLFTDSLHPMKEGNRLLAQALQSDLEPWLYS